MTEKIRSFNLLSPTVSGSANSGVGGGSVAIGNPTLISSTLSTHHTLTPTVDLINARDTNSSPPAIQMVSTLAAAAAATTATACIATGTTVTAQLNFHISGDSNGNGNGNGNGAMAASCVDYNSIMNSSQISAITNDSMLPVNNYTQTPATTMPGNCMSLVKAGAGKPIIAQSVAGKSCRFPKLEECAHFHYERVQLGPLTVRLIDDKADLLNSSIASQSIGGDIAGTAGNFCIGSGGGLSSLRSFSPSTCWFIIKVSPHRSDAFLIKRSFDNVQMLDEMLHRCVYDRKISGLKNLNEVDYKSEEDVEYAVAKYLERFSKIASDSLTCGTILTWFQLDNKGRRLPLADSDTMRSINTPAVGAAYGVRRYQAQASDEISIEVGDMISVIDMPAPAESIWWRGKKSHLQKSHYEVGFFPQSCVATIGDKVPRHFPMPAPLVGQLDVSPTKPVLRKHGKLIAFFRSFILSRPSRRRLKQSGIYRERVFSCDLSEHLLNSGQEIPMVLKCCAEFLEKYGIVDGIYRLSGITSNIQRLRRAFDEERIPDLGNPEMKQDIHAVSSLLKMYFRELPNPLCTYQLYDNFVEAIQAKAESNERLRLMKETVLKLPPPHYRTLKYLAEHLNKISQHAERTGMTDKNLAIVWAPNLLRSPALESGGVAALRGVGVQAVVTEYLIKNCQQIFDTLEDATTRLSYIATQGAQPTCQPPLYGIDSRLDSLTDCESLLVEQREHDQSLTCAERPKSLGTGGPKLISLEEAQERHLKLETFEMKHSMPINMTNSVNAGPNIGSYIEVGGGPSSLPDKYHTVLSVPRSWQKRKTHSWKSLFTRNQRPISNGAAHDLKSSIVVHKHNCDHAMATPLPRHKESAQVTFADTDSIIGLSGRSTTKGSLSKREDKQHKSIELFETSRSYCGEPSKPIEVCVRSNSIDSLRTAGHSRSVSHDSYFDLLQSPQRSNITTCPSRELSELGLNFDREEPEMHIFSESESLVSSPRVGKENIPPSSGAATRRIMRARPEDFSSQTNSVNPSPKKQPRLNLLLSPSSATTTSATSNWSQSKSASEPECSSDNCYEHHGDESCCKRYKLEDQLSDIQFIDCGTPEHTISQPPQTLYASAQIHGPIKATLAKSSPYGALEMKAQQTKESPKTMSKALAAATTNTPQNVRYSYPTVQLGSKRKDQDMAGATNNIKERFSYPGSNLNIDRHFSAKDAISKILVEEIEINGRVGGGGVVGNKKEDAQRHHNINLRNVSFGGSKTAANSTNSSPKISMQQHMVSKPTSFDVMKLKSRNSCGGGLDNVQQQLLRSSSAELTKSGDAGVQSKPSLNDMEISKISVTPSSPVQSPRYSLLMGGETSSENSSAVNTPQHDLDPLMVGSITSGISAASSNQMQQLLLSVEAMNYLGTSHESLGSNMTDTRDIQALKRELSLDLNPLSTKLSTEMIHLGQRPINLISPNNSNFTDNTSQSVTPSEFGYQHLQRQLSMHSLIETEDNSPAYEEYENTPSNLNSPMKLATSPLKSTISITYNLKSPTKPDNTTNKFFGKTKDKSRPMLETSFDENTVYEQVKFFRNSVTEVNQLLCDEHKYHNTELENLAEVEELSDSENEAEKLLLLSNDSNEENYENGTNSILNNCTLEQHVDDILMMDNCSESGKLMLYENIQIRKPTTIYQNLLGEEMKGGDGGDGGVERTVSTIKLEDDSETAHLLPQEEEEEEVELDSLDSIKEEEGTESQRFTAAAARRSPSNLSVKELANKFESSPVEQLPAFDFHNHPLRASHKRSQHINNENKPPRNPNITSGTLLKPKLNKTQQQITRSLDENAFVREFGAKNLQDFSVRSSQQLPDITEINNRRKSFDFTRPKTLNPPKRLPGMPITEEVYVKSKGKTQLKQEPAKEKNFNTLSYIQTGSSALDNHLESGELKITPTTENRISLIQNNVIIAADNNAATNSNTTADLNNSNNLSNMSTGSSSTTSTAANSSISNSLKVLSGVKLDRERIDRIKEERRQQLTQKYYNDFKSKSKTDLHSYKNDDEKFSSNSSLRVKSKSRADMRTLQKDMDNLKEFGGRHPPSTAVSELNLNSTQHRIRSISDEKNQNNYDNTNANTNLNSNLNSNSNPNASCVADMNRRSQITKSNVQEGRSDEFSARATVQKFERKSMDFVNGINGTITGNRERQQRSSLEMSSNAYTAPPTGRNSLVTNREKISPQFSIRDVTAMFESRSQSQQ